MKRINYLDKLARCFGAPGNIYGSLEIYYGIQNSAQIPIVLATSIRWNSLVGHPPAYFGRIYNAEN